IQYAPEYSTLATDLIISVRKANTNEWVQLTLAFSDPVDTAVDVFKTATVTTTDAIPEDAMEIKIEMANSVVWTMFLDELNLTWLSSDLVDDPEEEITGPTAPEIDYNFIDLIEGGTLANEMSDNWEFFTPHPESDLDVAGKTNGKKGTMVYYKEGSYIDNFALKLQVAPAFFNPDNHMIIQVQTEGSEEWTVLNIAADYFVKINGTFSTVWIEPAEALPENVTQISFAFYNDVAWTQFMDEVHINYVEAEEDSSTPEDESSSVPEDESSSTPEDESSSTPEDESSSTPEDESSSTPEDESTSLPDTGVTGIAPVAVAALISGLALVATLRRKED
ncbi:MAG: LPXTG cell wall anchor domain-containing protein, partial [Oscillospiraceae bacterium]|nr:LPXTG cell wall anchor domain-containing protein [Oscillospiraceae bacterium]